MNLEEFEVEEFGENQVDASELESWKVDKYIEEVKSNKEEIKKLEEIYKQRVDELTLIFNQKKERLEKQNGYLIQTLGQYALQQENLKETKTQLKYTSLNGDIVIKKAKKDFVKPKDDKLNDIEKIYPELIKKEESKKLNWKDLKAKLVMQGDNIYDKETGEDLTNVIEYEIKSEEIDIK